ncbi:VanZ family protein [Robertmurraya korlensis]|uniref:VanZ family protein n=1 Tax=Robertmurraya korlensis TaxID=519977 RepID=UPI00082632C4|nr:VanZ family protein [Robertmurraya korlensis]
MFIIRLLLLVLPFVYMALIWIQTSNFDPESVYMLSTKIDMRFLLLIGAGLELAHLFEFGLLYLFIIFGFLLFGKLTTTKEIIAIILAGGYGVLDEIHQYFVPFRSFSYLDLLKNATGVLALWYLTRRKYMQENSKLGAFLKKLSN